MIFIKKTLHIIFIIIKLISNPRPHLFSNIMKNLVLSYLTLNILYIDVIGVLTHVDFVCMKTPNQLY